MLFASFALSPSLGGATQTAAGADGVAQSPLPPPLLPADAASAETQCDAQRDAWAASVYQQLAASCLLSPSLDTRLPTVPVILHPSAPRGAAAQPVTARHIGFLRVDLTDAAEEEQGVDTGSLDRFGCTGHWASSGCIRLLTAAAVATQPGITGCSSGLALLPPEAFAALWARCEAVCGSSSSTPCDWHVPYSRLLPLEEAYGGLYRELKAGGYDLSRCHYMLRGWKTREGRPRLGASAPRSSTTTGGGQRARRHRGVVPAALAATRDLRAMVNWPGLLELLEEEGVEAVPTDGMRYWLARLAAGFQAQLAAAGVLCAETSVHHIIARSARGIDHPLNYFLIDRGPNSAMGSKVEGFRDADGNKLHMRDVVGERAFEVAHAACCLYHGVLYAGRRRGAPPAQTLRELREGATALAEEALQARQATAARQQARRAGASSSAAA
ncbi:hypothetical protein D9Q98_000591 [Chlorella vulgaris]|uniref:Uncharacterized protein n=1 Tax=Chlorella vulgaris TaxID=3077 RepID=A0A9D4TYN2_CHLVU|nr:hypothetical protein D9Q98_000591 [Chlorella vulgaris]